MSLSERDKLDLAGLASELEASDSADRARDLVQSDPEAATFVQQISTICQALRAHGESSPPPLSAEEADRLAAAISTRAQQAGARRRLKLRRWQQWGSIAAVLALVAVTWVSFNRKHQPVIAQATFIPITASLGPPKADRFHPVPIQAGQAVESQGGYVVLNLTNGSHVAVDRSTRLTVQHTGQVIELQSGSLFIQAAAPMRVLVGETTVLLDADKSIVMVKAPPPMCQVYAGRAKFIRHSGEAQISEGQIGTWSDNTGQPQIASFPAEFPRWVKNALDAAKP